MKMRRKAYILKNRKYRTTAHKRRNANLSHGSTGLLPPPFFFPQEAFVDHFPMSVANLEKHMHECIMVPVTKFFVYLFEYCCKCVLKCTHLFWENWIFCNKSTVRNIVESFKYCACAHAHTHTPYLSEYRHHSESKKSQQFASF